MTTYYELPLVEGWKAMGELAGEFYSMRPSLCHELFDILHRAFGDSPFLGHPLGWLTLR